MNWYGIKNLFPHAIILWLAIRKKLTTKDMLVKFGLINDATCILCDNGNENVDNLFFQCSFSNYNWKKSLEINGLGYRSQGWDGYTDRLAKS